MFLYVIVSDEIVAESLEKLMENKLVREKKIELEKKLELRMQTQKGSIDGEKHKSKFYVSHKLVKRLSSRNM